MPEYGSWKAYRETIVALLEKPLKRSPSSARLTRRTH